MFTTSLSPENSFKVSVQHRQRTIRGPILSIKRYPSVVRQSTLRTKSQAFDDIVLVGDIGGTNARLSLRTTSKSTTKSMELVSMKYPTMKYKTFDLVLKEFLSMESTKNVKPKAASLAIAGAIEKNKCHMTNLNWVIDGNSLHSQFGFKVALLNDFEAVGYGIPALDATDLVCLNDGPIRARAPKVVMGPGTGLGAAQLCWDEGLGHYRVLPGEGAHATFAPRGWKQQALSNFATARFGHCEIEQVACGSGLELIYEFLLSDEVANRPELLREKAAKQAAEITAAALSGADPVAEEAVDIFLAIVGQEAGAMALRVLASGGVYIAGGIIPRLLPRVRGSLLEGFLMRNGRAPFRRLLAKTPLFVITNDKIGQLGATEVAKRLIDSSNEHPVKA